MNSIRHILLFGVTVAIFISCTHAPRSLKQTEAAKNIRSEYFRDHPDGKFNNHISKGELVKGMSVLEVLAAWGIPGQRELTDRNTETWTYISRDDFSKDYVSYSLVFRDQILTRWLLERNTAAGRFQPPPGIDGTATAGEAITLPRAPAFRSGKSAPNK